MKDSTYRQQFIDAAANLTDTCRMMYSTWQTHIGPEVATIRAEGIHTATPHYLLRPEYVESLFLMWRFTRDPRYREWGWDAFYSMVKNCQVGSGGFSGIKDVRNKPCTHDDVQQSFFLAETIKYLFLLFADDSLVPLDRWVFNTEAHPLRIRTRDPLAEWPKEYVEKREEAMKRGVQDRIKEHRQNKAWISDWERLHPMKGRQTPSPADSAKSADAGKPKADGGV